MDVNADGQVTALDALLVINSLGSESGVEGESAAAARRHFDVNGDSRVSALDALKIINHLAKVHDASLNSLAGTQAERSGQTDAVVIDVDEEDELLSLLADDVSRQLF